MLDEHSSTEPLQNSEDFLAPVANIADAPAKRKVKVAGGQRAPTAAEKRAAKQAGETGKPKKTPLGVRQKVIMRTFLRTQKGTSPLTDPDVRFLCCLDRDGVEKELLTVDDKNICRPITKKRLSAEVAEYLEKNLGDDTDYAFEASHCYGTADLIMQTALAEPERPKNWRLGNDPGTCFWRVPLEIIYSPDQKQYPLWLEMMGRLTNRRAVMAWIGSLFFEKSYLQQYLWIFGKGRQGKGSLGRFLIKLFSKAYAHSAQRPPHPDNVFWAVPFVDRRIMVYGDCTDPDMVTQSWFKGLTGADLIEVVQKYGIPFSYEHNCKLLLFANCFPKPSDQQSDTERLIFSELSDRVGGIDPQYEDKLWAEGGAFIGACIGIYLEDCPNHEPIKNDADTLELIRDLGDSLNSDFQDFIEEYYVRAPDLGPKEMRLEYHTSRLELRQRFDRRWPKDNNKFKQFLEWGQTHGIRDEGFKLSNNKVPIRAYTGIKNKY